MSNLFSSLHTASNALRVFEKSIDTIQNNVSNVSTPGFAAQRLDLQALPFQLENNLAGGVTDRGLVSSRNQFAEREVRRQVESLGNSSQQAQNLAGIAALFDVTGKTGIPAALARFFQSVSSWGVAPNSTTARQAVLESARDVAASFRQTAAGLAEASAAADTQIAGNVARVNTITATLASLNSERARSQSPDPGLDAKIHNNLEQLSELVDFSVLYPADGTVTVLLGGQSPLVIGDNHFEIRAGSFQPANPPPVNPSAPPQAQLLDSDGKDITAEVTGGRLGGLLSVRNGLLASLLGDSQQAGDLNALAKRFADRVNELLTQGHITDGPPPQSGEPLFSYSPSDATATASTLGLTNITADRLAAIEPGPPEVGNGVALQLAGLVNSIDPADQVDGLTYVAYFGSLAGRVGNLSSQAQDRSDQQSQAVAQARNLRQQVSGVSLDAEAARLVELQRSYQAAAQLISIISSLTETVINMLRG
jgi:flagellar hook-associated protein 1 FlgK